MFLPTSAADNALLRHLLSEQRQENSTTINKAMIIDIHIYIYIHVNVDIHAQVDTYT